MQTIELDPKMQARTYLEAKTGSRDRFQVCWSRYLLQVGNGLDAEPWERSRWTRQIK